VESRRPNGSAGREQSAAASVLSPPASSGASAPPLGRPLLRSFARSIPCALLLGLGAFALPAAAASPRPSLRLFAAQHRVTVAQGELRAGVVDLGLWVASVGGGFQIDVRRPHYGAWRASQVDPATGAPLRSVPMGVIDPGRGFERFLSVRFLDSRGRMAARQLMTFCPNGESARVDDTGALNQTYPGDCLSASFFPFVRGLVWGIDPGWAVSPFSGAFLGFPPGSVGVIAPGATTRVGPGAVNLKPGGYTAIVSITPFYRRLLAIPARQASVRLRVRVLATRRAHGRPPIDFPPPADRASGPLAARTVAQPDPATLPNLVAAPAWRISVQRLGRRELLTFSATIWNAGPAPFSIEGFRRPNSDVMDAYEYFFDSSGNVVGRARAGAMFYDHARGHHHWHLRQLASYQLVGPSGRAVRSHKQSFCIAPTDAVDLTLPGAARGLAAGGFGFGGSVCDLYSPDAIWLREQLPVGWGDTYTQVVAGQAIDVTNVPNGRYRLEVRVNPLGELHETTTADDLAVRIVRLSGHGKARKAWVAPWHGIRG
jgi:Lysyl oxidase